MVTFPDSDDYRLVSWFQAGTRNLHSALYTQHYLLHFHLIKLFHVFICKMFLFMEISILHDINPVSMLVIVTAPPYWFLVHSGLKWSNCCFVSRQVLSSTPPAQVTGLVYFLRLPWLLHDPAVLLNLSYSNDDGPGHRVKIRVRERRRNVYLLAHVVRILTCVCTPRVQ